MEVRVEKKGREGRRVADLFYENTAKISSGVFPDARGMNKKEGGIDAKEEGDRENGGIYVKMYFQNNLKVNFLFIESKKIIVTSKFFT